MGDHPDDAQAPPKKSGSQGSNTSHLSLKFGDHPDEAHKGNNSSDGLISEGSDATRNSLSMESMHSIQRYLCALLNHELSYPPETPSLIAPVIWAEAEKQASAGQWHITADLSVRAGRKDLARYLALKEVDRKRAAFRAANKNAEMPKEDGKVIAERRKLEGKAVKKMWRVSGVELASSVLQFNNRTDWLPKLQQINEDLAAEDHRAFFPEAEDAGLHVHVAINGTVDTNLDSPLGLACIKNVIALYGLFEDEIGKWFPVPRRDNIMAVRMRHGMEATADPEIAPLYTPQLFTELLYETTTVKELVTLTTNSEKGKFVTVCISENRRNKPTTLEFRQHHGTIDSETIKWWITFTCQLVKFAMFLAQFGIEVRDKGSILDASLPPDRSSFVDKLCQDNSILDLIGFSVAGKKFYKEATELHKDAFHDAERELDLWIIGMRGKASRRAGRVTMRSFDTGLRETNEYKAEVKRLEGMFKVSGLKQKEARFSMADSWMY